MNERVFARVEPVLLALSRYHRHEVQGLERVPRAGPVLIVFNHSLATYDALLLALAIHRRTGRIVRGLADRLMFRIPLVAQLAGELGILEGSQENGRRLLEAGELVMVSPGGMREALRPGAEAFRINWSNRLGFVRLAALTRSPILLAACPMADRIFDVYPCALTRAAYERFRIPLPFARGLGPTLLPRPVKLLHAVDGPLAPPTSLARRAIERFHAAVVARMEALMAATLAAAGSGDGSGSPAAFSSPRVRGRAHRRRGTGRSSPGPGPSPP